MKDKTVTPSTTSNKASSSVCQLKSSSVTADGNLAPSEYRLTPSSREPMMAVEPIIEPAKVVNPTPSHCAPCVPPPS